MKARAVSNVDRVRELAAKHGCSVWADGKGNFRLEIDGWGHLLHAGTLEEVERSLNFAINPWNETA
jgi:hypothetical protein